MLWLPCQGSLGWSASAPGVSPHGGRRRSARALTFRVVSVGEECRPLDHSRSPCRRSMLRALTRAEFTLDPVLDDRGVLRLPYHILDGVLPARAQGILVIDDPARARARALASCRARMTC